MKAYKGTDKDLKCQGFQYEVGKEYSTDKPVELCQTGFNACENPLDVWSFYPPGSNRYVEVEQSGETKTDGVKTCSAKIAIKAELDLTAYIKMAVAWMAKTCKATVATGNYGHAAATGNYGNAAATGDYGNAAAAGYSGHAAATGNYGHAAATGNYGNAAATGDYGNAAATGDYGNAAATGYSGNAAATGNYGHAAATGEQSIAASVGTHGYAKASHGWIVIADWRNGKYGWIIHKVHAAAVGGKIGKTTIKADTWYWFEDGELKESAE